MSMSYDLGGVRNLVSRRNRVSTIIMEPRRRRIVMNAAPNQTCVKAVVKQITPATDGYGSEVDLESLANESANPAADYLQPKKGDRLKVFAAAPGKLDKGARIRATLGLLGGPTGERAVLRNAEPLG